MSQIKHSTSASHGARKYLIESIKNIRDQRRTRARISQSLHQAKVAQISDISIGGGRGKSQRITPEVPLEGNNRERGHTGPDHTQSGLSTSKTGVKETETGDHHHNHRGGHDDIGLVTRLEPFVQVFGACPETREQKQQSVKGVGHVRESPPRSGLVERE